MSTPVFPNVSLGIKLEILLNATWTDITKYLYQRNPVQIANRGRPDWTQQMQASQMTLTLNNRDGRFSPKNTAGAFYPYITRNVQVRLSVNAQSVTGVTYNGYRFWGEVSEWPPGWDVSGRDVYCNIVVSGIWRRLSNLQTTLGSAYRRYYLNNLTGSSKPQGYWPMEDGTGSTAFIPWIPVTAASGTWTGTPSLAAGTGFQGSDAIPQLNQGVISFTVPSGGTATNNVTWFLLSVPSTGDSGSGSTAWNIIEIDSAGTIAKFEVYLNPNGTLAFNLRNSAGTIIAQGTTASDVAGQPYLVSCELTPSGSNVAFALRIIVPDGASVHESLTGTVTSASIGAVTSVKFNRSAKLSDTAVGHLSVTYGAVPSLVSAAYALSGYTGEYAMTRFTRLCGELGIAYETIGTASTTAAMGPQLDDTLASVLQIIETTDCGLLYETTDQLGLGYRSNASMANQAAAVVMAYTSGGAGVLDPALTPAYDDQLTWNDVTLTNWTGNAWEAILTAGPMSISSPPNGIGNGYALQRNVSAASDSQVAGIANFLLNLGSVDEVRFPVVTVQLARRIGQAPALFSSLPSLRIGDYFQITGMPSFLTGSTVRQLVWGITETLNARQWTLSFNSVPESPWETGFSPGTIQTAQIPGSGAVSTAGPGGSLASQIANGSITPAMLSNGITIHTLGGNAVTIAVSAPSNPNTNDIWINSGTGLISQWNGTAWAPITFNATNTIQAGTITAALIAAGTIVASNIAAGTITAALLAAGIIVAGIVNGTTITGASIVADGSSGEVLVYSGTPANGNLIGSWSGAAGTDPQANTYPLGLMAQALNLPDQATDPAAVSGSSTFFSSVAGRPIYLSQAGNRSVLERSVINTAGFPIGNTTTPTAISAFTTYLANEGAQSSEYEIEIDGTITTGSGTAVSLNFQLGVDGTLTGPHLTIGATFLASGAQFFYNLKWRVTIEAVGAPGTVMISYDGVICKSANVGSESSFPVINAGFASNNSSVSFDTTTAHTLQMYATWNGTNSGQSMETFRTRLARRN